MAFERALGHTSGMFRDKSRLPDPDRCLPGRSARMPVAERHFVLNTPLVDPFPPGSERVQFGMGCFWGAERKFWELDGVISTAAGYAAGSTPNPTYEEVCSGMTELVVDIFANAEPSVFPSGFAIRAVPAGGLRLCDGNFLSEIDALGNIFSRGVTTGFLDFAASPRTLTQTGRVEEPGTGRLLHVETLTLIETSQ